MSAATLNSANTILILQGDFHSKKKQQKKFMVLIIVKNFLRGKISQIRNQSFLINGY